MYRVYWGYLKSVWRVFKWCFLSVWGCLESVWKVSWECLQIVLQVSRWVFGKWLVRFIHPIVFLVCKYLICMVRTGWVKTGRVSSFLNMSGLNIIYQNVLDLDIFGIQNVFSDKKICWSKIFGTQNYFGIKIPLDPNLFVLIFLGTKI